MNKTRNNISVGSKVLWTGPSKLVPQQNSPAKGTLKSNQIYTVSFVFPGEEFEQVELEGVEQLFAHDMFKVVPDALAKKLGG